MKRKAVLVFGGPGLPEGTHTWYLTPEGKQIQAVPGDEVAADQVQNLQGYLDREQAELRDAAAGPTLGDRSPGAAGDVERT